MLGKKKLVIFAFAEIIILLFSVIPTSFAQEQDDSLEELLGQLGETATYTPEYEPWLSTLDDGDIERYSQYLYLPILGDANNDGGIDISDAKKILDYLFLNDNQMACLRAADVNQDEMVDISDAMYLISYLYTNGPPPADIEIPRSWCFFYDDPIYVFYEQLKGQDTDGIGQVPESGSQTGEGEALPESPFLLLSQADRVLNEIIAEGIGNNDPEIVASAGEELSDTFANVYNDYLEAMNDLEEFIKLHGYDVSRTSIHDFPGIGTDTTIGTNVGKCPFPGSICPRGGIIHVLGGEGVGLQGEVFWVDPENMPEMSGNLFDQLIDPNDDGNGIFVIVIPTPYGWIPMPLYGKGYLGQPDGLRLFVHDLAVGYLENIAAIYAWKGIVAGWHWFIGGIVGSSVQVASVGVGVGILLGGYILTHTDTTHMHSTLTFGELPAFTLTRPEIARGLAEGFGDGIEFGQRVSDVAVLIRGAYGANLPVSITDVVLQRKIDARNGMLSSFEKLLGGVIGIVRIDDRVIQSLDRLERILNQLKDPQASGQISPDMRRKVAMGIQDLARLSGERDAWRSGLSGGQLPRRTLLTEQLENFGRSIDDRITPSSADPRVYSAKVAEFLEKVFPGFKDAYKVRFGGDIKNAHRVLNAAELFALILQGKEKLYIQQKLNKEAMKNTAGANILEKFRERINERVRAVNPETKKEFKSWWDEIRKKSSLRTSQGGARPSIEELKGEFKKRFGVDYYRGIEVSLLAGLDKKSRPGATWVPDKRNEDLIYLFLTSLSDLDNNAAAVTLASPSPSPLPSASPSPKPSVSRAGATPSPAV